MNFFKKLRFHRLSGLLVTVFKSNSFSTLFDLADFANDNMLKYVMLMCVKMFKTR